MDKQWKEYKIELTLWENKQKKIRERNEELIKEWNSVPWWKFWEQTSFEVQRSIIIFNWHSLGSAPLMPMPSFYFDLKTKKPTS